MIDCLRMIAVVVVVDLMFLLIQCGETEILPDPSDSQT